MLSLNHKFLELQSALIPIHLELCRIFLELSELHCETGKILVFPTGDRPEEFKLDLSLNLILAEVRCTNLDLVPFESATFLPLDLRLVNWGVLPWGNVPVNDEEAETAVVKLSDWVENDNLCVGRRSHLLRRDNDPSRLSYSALLILEILSHDLIARCHDLVERKLIHSNVIMCIYFLCLVRPIVRIVHLDLKLLFLLKMKLYQDLLYKLWVQIVMDKLSLADLLPAVINCLIENAERVRFTESVHVWQFLTLEPQGQLLGQALA